MNENFFRSAEWEQVKKRYTAFWNNEPLKRPLFHLVSPIHKESQDFDVRKSKWLEIERRVEDVCRGARNNKFYADAFPRCFVNFGPGVLSACIGGDFVLAENTVWFDRNPILDTWDNLDKIKFYNDAPMWGYVQKMTDLCVDNSDTICTSVTDIGGTLDVIASLRGSETLLYDLIDEPDKVKKAIEIVEPLWEYMFNILADKIMKKQDGLTSWMQVWCPNRHYPLQCDFSAMISPDMFEEFVLPNLKRQTEFLDNSIYHLDGPGELPHLDHILSLPRLDLIQWVPGSGAAPMSDPCWYEMYEKIFAAGKGIILLGNTPDEAEILLKKFAGKRIFIELYCEDEKRALELNHLYETL